MLNIFFPSMIFVFEFGRNLHCELIGYKVEKRPSQKFLTSQYTKMPEHRVTPSTNPTSISYSNSCGGEIIAAVDQVRSQNESSRWGESPQKFKKMNFMQYEQALYINFVLIYYFNLILRFSWEFIKEKTM